MKIIKVERTIFFYELEIDFLPEFKPEDNNQIRELFQVLYKLSKTRSGLRRQVIGERMIFLHQFSFDNINKHIEGKMRSVRMDVFPELFNTETDEIKDIEALDNEGIVETTHFVIDYKPTKPVLAIEFNQTGAKIKEFIVFMEKVGVTKAILTKFEYTPIVIDDLESMKNRLNRCSEMEVRVHKNNLPLLKELDGDDGATYTAMKAAIDHFNCEYAQIFMKFNYRNVNDTNEVTSFFRNIIRKIGGKRKHRQVFDRLVIVGEDNENYNVLEAFDLLVPKIKKKIKVQRKPKGRSIVSNDMFPQIKNLLYELNL